MVFWAITGALTLAILLVLARKMVGTSMGESETSGASTENSDVKVYRDQLKELDRDLARGTVTEDEAERTRLEISRRLLEADRKAQSNAAPSEAPIAATRAVLALVAVTIVASGFGLYWALGAPGYPDFGLKSRLAMAQEIRDTRPSQAEVEAKQPEWAGPPAGTPDDYLSLIASLRSAVEKNPTDPRGLALLVQHESALENPRAAANAMATLIEVQGDETSGADYARYADLLILSAGGFVSPEAEEALRQTFLKDPKNQIARYYTGLMFAQNARADLAFRMWRGLLEEGPDDAPWITPIRGQIMGLAQVAGVEYTLPERQTAPQTAGPSAEDIEAAGEMNAQDRGQMIQGMVTRLSERLATEGGAPEEWAQLISALGVLGEMDRAKAIWTEAQGVFATKPDALKVIQHAAKNAGITQ